MILAEDLRKIVRIQHSNILSLDMGIKREKLSKINFKVPHAIIISGIRRCGKSTLLRQIINTRKNFYYLNFEDPKLVNFELSDFDKLDKIFMEEYGEHGYYFFDEIQNIKKWEIYVRSLLDRNKKVIITGSNSSLLSRELGTRLTGRHIRYELFPFSYREMLTFKKTKAGINSFKEYMNFGGFPEYIKYSKAEILEELLNDILLRDIVVRYKLRSSKTVKELAIYLLSNIGREISYNKLKKTFNLGSTNTITSFISYFEDSYLLFTLSRFDYSIKKQIINPKKIYSIDNGMCSVNSISFSSDKGRMLENIVFINLRHNYKNLFYFRENKECDFIIKSKNKIKDAIQVCYKLNKDNKDREISGLIEAMNKFKLKKGLILTYNQNDKFVIHGNTIIVKPVWEWLMGESVHY